MLVCYGFICGMKPAVRLFKHSYVCGLLTPDQWTSPPSLVSLSPLAATYPPLTLEPERVKHAVSLLDAFTVVSLLVVGSFDDLL